MDTYNIYMDEASVDGLNGDSEVDVNFRVVSGSMDTEDAEENAVIVGLDLIDLMNLRDALQNEIDSFTLLQFEANALAIESAALLLGQGYGTGPYWLYGAFTIDLDACTILDDRQAEPIVENIQLER